MFGPTRINKFLAHATGMSRRDADNAVANNRVAINGVPATMGARVEQNDIVTLDNGVIGRQQAYQYIALHKPVGYVCSRHQQDLTPTVYDLLPQDFAALKTVGRLDKDSSGIILLTNDGDFAYNMTHPQFYKTKIYKVELDKPLEALHQQIISDYGIELEDGQSRFLLARLDETGSRGDNPVYEITMHEGRNRQIRRTFASLGYTVTRLHRIQFGSYSLDDLQPGEYRHVTLPSPETDL